MKLCLLILLFCCMSLGLWSQTECPTFGSKKPRFFRSNEPFLHYGLDIFTLIYADNPWVFSIYPHLNVNGEINILRRFTVGSAMGSHFALTLNTDIPAFREPYIDNIHFKFFCKIYLNKAFNGLWLGYSKTVDNKLLGVDLLEIGYTRKVSKLGLINYYVGVTPKRELYVKPYFLSLGLTLGILKRRQFFKFK